MRMVQSGIMITVIDALILLWCVRQVRMVQSGIMITVIDALILPRFTHLIRLNDAWRQRKHTTYPSLR